jgi:hypothetical protein
LPGQILRWLIASVGLQETGGCGCKDLAAKMDAWGVAGCEEHRPEILEKLRLASKDVPIAKLLRAARKAMIRGLWINPVDPATSLLNHALKRAQRREPELIFTLPPGIGDCSWVWSKLAAVAEQRPIAVRVARSSLARALNFVELLDVDCLGWGQEFSEDLDFVDFHVDLAALEPGEYNLFANPHLEAGHRLEDAWPAQETRFHYPIRTTPAMARRADQIVGVPSSPVIGFYCSSGRRDDRWQNMWRMRDWLHLLEGIAGDAPGATFVAVSALYDRRTAAVAGELRRRGHQVAECIGPSIGVTVEVMRRLSYFVAYPSGLGVVADVLDLPTMMFYWRDFHDLFLNSYADPENVRRGRHMNLLFCEPGAALDAFRSTGLKWIRSSSA